MINVDTRILSKMDENEYWLMTHLIKFLGKKESVWPSNKTLCKDTGWNIDKLQRVKKSLVEKKFVSVEVKFNTSNVYRFHTKLMKIYTDVDGAELEEKRSTGKHVIQSMVKDGNLSTGKHGNEVLVNEVLVNEPEDSNESSLNEPELFDIPKAKKPIDSSEKKQTEGGAVFKLFVHHWLKVVHPGWKFKSVDGKMMKEIIERVREYAIAKAIKDGADSTWLPSDNHMINSFSHFCKSLEWVSRGFYKTKNLTILNSNFDGIIEEIRTGGPKQQLDPNNPRHTSAILQQKFGGSSFQ